jgi:transcription-repair coupling factor (superfamily II helicase)
MEDSHQRLRELGQRLSTQQDFAALAAALAEGKPATIDGVWGGLRALGAEALLEFAPSCLMIVCPRPDEADRVIDDLAIFSDADAVVFPPLEAFEGEHLLHDEGFGERLRLLKRFLGPLHSKTPQLAIPRVIVTSPIAMLQPVPDRETVGGKSMHLSLGEQRDPAEITRWLTEGEFHGTTGVELPGEFAWRGHILDLFAPEWEQPVRIEFFGDEIESMRHFEVASQRSLDSVSGIELTRLRPEERYEEHFIDLLPDDTWVMLLEPEEIELRARQYQEGFQRPQLLHSRRAVMQRLMQHPLVSASTLAPAEEAARFVVPAESVEKFRGELETLRRRFEEIDPSDEVHLVCQTEGEIQRLRELFGDSPPAKENRLHFSLGRLSGGFRLLPMTETPGVTVLDSGEMFQRTEVRRTRRRRLGKAIDSFIELRPGDLVVHVSHGIARFRGIELLTKGHQQEEHLKLEFAEKTTLFVPISKIGLVQKYIGGNKARPRLAKLGGKRWARHKDQVKEAVFDMASDMLELQAARATLGGIPFPADSRWQQEFDSEFPYRETEDQLAAIASVKEDMLRPRSMDRLICGDVGFGKTEVAMRAVFKAVDAGYQVAVLVPTTILAEQHYRTFRERMAEFPFAIASLSRFATKKEQAATLEGLALGTIDIVVGTHRLAQGDVAFDNLGLVIIDEEQRFGVQIKERLKELRKVVDVLTMTATPIPRTLHMSLLGLRDISNLETPPEDRMSVETRIARFQRELIRTAILRELHRNGQVYFVHNRVRDIEQLASKLREIVPEARIEVGHAQMPENQLEDVMVRFVGHQFDVLVCTTIIESGLDIPNANTIFIDQADRYGLSDLHQLRGRVGRYKHQAYCYLLIDPHKHLTPVAARRLRALEEYSALGSGFAIAMRDLEIRGAGNILGTQQSGHIAMVGYELYCQFLENAVRRLKNEPPRTMIDVEMDLPGKALLPRDYIADQRMKIDLYRRLARVTQPEEIASIAEEIRDRFGPLPEVVCRLLAMAEIRIEAHRHRLRSLRIEEDYLVMDYLHRPSLDRLRRASEVPIRIVDTRTAYVPLPEKFMKSSPTAKTISSTLPDSHADSFSSSRTAPSEDGVLEFVKSLLQSC